MALDLVLSWIAAAVATGILLSFGVRNRHNGYQRHRSDVPADAVLLWALSAAEERGTAAGIQPSRSIDHSADLLALGAFVGNGQPVAVIEADTHQLPAQVLPSTTEVVHHDGETCVDG